MTQLDHAADRFDAMRKAADAPPKPACTVHTPVPWHANPAGRHMRDDYTQSYALTQYGEANLIAGFFADVKGGEGTAEANARFAQRACNNHYRLVAALEALTKLHADQVFICGEDDQNRVEKALKEANRALMAAQH